MYKRKSWKEKLHDSKDFPRVQPIEKQQEKIWGEGTIVIAKPIEVDEFMKKAPKGKKNFRVLDYENKLVKV